MWRNERWDAGYYIDNHKKYSCFNCDKEFIVGEKLLEDCVKKSPICPYCGGRKTECIVETNDNELEELSDSMGCLALYVEL